MKIRAKDLRKRLMIKFTTEEGLDYGGIARLEVTVSEFIYLDSIYSILAVERLDVVM